MKKRTIATSLAALAVVGGVATAANASGSSPAPQISEVTVQAAVGTPLDTDVVLNSQFSTLTVTATDTTNWGGGITGPNGAGFFLAAADTRPIPLKTAPVGALVGKIGEDGDWFLVGASKTITYLPSVPPAPPSYSADGKVGQLFLEYNDVTTPASLADNSGSYKVKIVRTKP